MAPKLTAEFTVLKLSYLPILIPPSNRIAIARYISYPTVLGYPVAKSWFDEVMREEAEQIVPGMHFRFSEWNINTDNNDITTVSGILYDEIYVVLGGEQVHWFLREVHSNETMKSSANLEVAYCPCCLSSHYMRIIGMIDKWSQNSFSI